MTRHVAESGASGLFVGGFGWGGVLLVMGMVLALAVVSGLGILARMRDRTAERRAIPATNSAATRDSQRSETPAAG